MSQIIDQAADIRQGEHIDIAALDAYLKEHLKGIEGELRIKQFPSGASNLTYLLHYSNKDFILRKPPAGAAVKAAHNMAREAGVLKALAPHYPKVPKVFLLCEDESIIGSQFFIMERLIGFIPRRSLPQSLNFSVDDTRRFCTNGLDELITLHQLDATHSDLAALGKGGNYVERQITGWSQRWQKAITDDCANFDKVITWLHDHQPKDIATCVIHNDFRFDNLVFNPEKPTEVIGVLDWEMATLGDPLMDLGNSLAYWVEASDDEAFKALRLQPTHTPGMLTRAEVVDYYLSASGHKVDNVDYYLIYGWFRLAVIVQQIYKRYSTGLTQDERFAGFASFTKALSQRCETTLAHWHA